MFQVNLKPGHPTGVYHRAGREFSASGPVEMDEVPEAIAKDPWLIVSEVKEEKKPAPKKKQPGGKKKPAPKRTKDKKKKAGKG